MLQANKLQAQSINKHSFPDLGKIAGAISDAKAKVEKAKNSTAQQVKAALVQVAKTLNDTLLKVETKVNKTRTMMLAKQDEFVTSIETLIQAKTNESATVMNASAKKAEGLVNKTFADLEGLLSEVESAGKGAATVFTSGLSAAGLTDIAKTANETLASAETEAADYKAKLVEAKDLLMTLTTETAPQKLGELNATLQAAMKDVGAYSDKFTSSFDSVMAGVKDKILKLKEKSGVALEQEQGLPAGATDALKASVASSMDEESKKEVQTAYESVVDTAKGLVGMSMGLASDFVTGVEEGIEATGIQVESGASRMSMAGLIVVPLATLWMGQL